MTRPGLHQHIEAQRRLADDLEAGREPSTTADPDDETPWFGSHGHHRIAPTPDAQES